MGIRFGSARRQILALGLLFWLAPPAEAETHLIAVGDSLTAGEDWLVHVPALAPGWTWEEHGLPGEDSWDAADEVHCGPSIAQCLVTQSTGRFRAVLAGRTRSAGDVIVLMWGTNDVRQPCWSDASPTGSEECRSFTRDALAQMIDDALALGYPVVVGVPPPVTDAQHSPHTAEETALFRTHLAVLHGMVEALLAERPHRRLVMANAFGDFQALVGWAEPWQGWAAEDYFRVGHVTDGIHPGSETNIVGLSGRLALAGTLVDGVMRVHALPVPAAGRAGDTGLVLLLLATGAGRACRSATARSC